MRKLALLSLLACAACTTHADGGAPSSASAAQPTTAPAPVSAPATTNGSTLAQITALIGKAECGSDQQCQVLPLGARPCGGPASYAAWSSAKTSGNELQALAARYRSEQQAANTRSGMMSDCRAIAPPAAVCKAGSCQLTDALSVQ